MTGINLRENGDKFIQLRIGYMKKLGVLIVFLVCHQFSYSQNDSLKLSKLWIKTNPLQYIDFYNGCHWQLGLEYKLNSKFSMNTEFGKIIYLKGWTNAIYHDGFYVRHEVKKYFQHFNTRKTNNIEYFYYSLEGVYSNQAMIRTDQIEFSNDTLYSKTYFSVRNVFGVSGLMGFVREYDCGFILEGMVGFGLRYNMVTNDLTEEESSNRLLGDWTVPTNYLIKKGNHIIPRFHFGIKVGWKIGK